MTIRPREDQIARLLAMGCKYGQGYYFSKPVDAEKTEDLLVHNRATTHPQTLQASLTVAGQIGSDK